MKIARVMSLNTCSCGFPKLFVELDNGKQHPLCARTGHVEALCRWAEGAPRRQWPGAPAERAAYNRERRETVFALRRAFVETRADIREMNAQYRAEAIAAKARHKASIDAGRKLFRL